MSNRVYDAPAQQSNVVPAYKIVQMDGPFLREQAVFDEKTKQIVKQQVQEDVGYMVFFPRGHSHMYYSLNALSRAGFSEVVPFINLANEAEVNKDHQPSTIHQPIERKTK